jgi:hypothetical protein
MGAISFEELLTQILSALQLSSISTVRYSTLIEPSALMLSMIMRRVILDKI